MLTNSGKLFLAAAVLLPSAVLAQPVTVGLDRAHFSAHPASSGVQTFIELGFGATRGGTVRVATLGWTNSPCPGAVKIKFFRSHSATDVEQTSYDLVDERGPFDVNEPMQPAVYGGRVAIQPVALNPPVLLQAGDLIALTVITPCGGPTYTGLPSGPPPSGSVLVVPGDVASAVRGSIDLEGTILAQARGIDVNVWTPIGPEAVPTESVAAAGGVILAGAGVPFCAQCPDGGLFRTTDGGITWTDVFPGLPTHAIAIAPSDPSIVYASRNGPGLTVWKSTDAGLTWAPTSLASGSVSILRIDALSASIVWAGAATGLYRSTDGGKTWSKVLDQPSIASIALSSSAPSLIYAGSLSYGAFRSSDGGQTWTPLPALGTPTIPTGLVGVEISSLAADPTDARRLFASARVNVALPGRPPDIPHLYRSLDSGDSWTLVVALDGSQVLSGQILVVPSSPQTIYVPSVTGVYRSDDRGLSWSLRSGLPAGSSFDFAIDPSDPSTLYAATSNGIARLTVDPTTLVLGGGRFEVRVAFRGAGKSGSAEFIGLSENTGAFWFFTPNNVEVVIKVLDGRPVNGHFWVFGAALTDVEYDVTITDTVTGAAWTRHNPPGRLGSYADTTAF